MSRNGSGVYTPPATSFPAVPSTLIESAKFNNIINDISAALSSSVAADGQTTITANLPMNSHKLTGLTAGSGAGDSVEYAQMNTAIAAQLASPTFTGNPTAPTPPQFDNDTSIATTAFVATASGSFSLWSSIAASRTLLASDIGQAIWFSVTCTLTIPTPTSLGLRLGSAVLLHATVGTVGTVTAGAGAAINLETTGVSSFFIKQGQSMTLIAVSSTTWQIVSSTAELGRNIDFASTLAASGSQKLPGGYIRKWGTATASGTPGAAVAVTFASAFPNGCFGVVITGVTTNTGNAAAWYDSPTTTGFNLRAALAGQTVFYDAVGY